jgi:hypothetical protein
VLLIPGGLFEVTLAIWLLVKGFTPAAYDVAGAAKPGALQAGSPQALGIGCVRSGTGWGRDEASTGVEMRARLARARRERLTELLVQVCAVKVLAIRRDSLPDSSSG